jgi:hypothetical protein
MDSTDALIERGELDGLLRLVDRMADGREWQALLGLADRCRRAHERGHQLWPASEHAWYRVALDGPAELACRAVASADGRFGLGPLTEVVASTHAWAMMAPHLDDGPVAATVAHERAIRGDDLSNARTLESYLEVPLVLQPWEPVYPVATYSEHSIDVGAPPDVGELRWIDVPDLADVADDDATDALIELVRAWTTQSNGTARAVAVRGSVREACAALGVVRARVAEIGLADALATMAWCAASGGARGRRRGTAAGRFDAWWAGAALADLEWPPDPAELGAALAALRWWRWDRGEPESGWVLRIAVEDHAAGLAWAIDAHDRAIR